jgi:hypothetical protein
MHKVKCKGIDLYFVKGGVEAGIRLEVGVGVGVGVRVRYED